jgi:branched-chain amino acid transport system permease protein
MGQLSFGQAGMMTIGAYTTALLSTKLGVPSWLALGAAPVTAAILALAVGYPFMRLKGVYFSLCTIFFSVILQLIADQWQNVTGGSFGINNIPQLSSIVFGDFLTIDFSSKVTYYYFMLILVLVVLVICYALEKSRLGVTWFSIKESDALSRSIGINITNYQVLAFCIGSLFAGLAGGLYAQYNAVITPGAFGFTYAVYVLLYMAVGGAKRFAGPILGSFVLILVPEIARPLKQYQPYLFAGVTILVIFLLPDGLISLPQRVISIIRERRHHA